MEVTISPGNSRISYLIRVTVFISSAPVPFRPRVLIRHQVILKKQLRRKKEGEKGGGRKEGMERERRKEGRKGERSEGREQKEKQMREQ
jgi:hypothetical protein